MNKREAKCHAYRKAALVVDGALGAGWELDRQFGTDAPKVVTALHEIVEQLHQRADRFGLALRAPTTGSET